MALPAGRYGVTKNQLLKIKKLPMNTIKLIEELTEKFDLLGTAAFKNSTSVVTDSTDLVESGAVYDALGFGNANLLNKSELTNQEGNTVTQITDGVIITLTKNDAYISTACRIYGDFADKEIYLKFAYSSTGNVKPCISVRPYNANGKEIVDNRLNGVDIPSPVNIHRTMPTGTAYLVVVVYGTYNVTGSIGDTVTYTDIMVSTTNIAYEPYHASVEETLRDAEVVEGKNLLPMSVAGIKALNTSGTWSGNVYTFNDVTFTIQVDSDGNVIGVKANGTANADTFFILADNSMLSSLANKSIILNGCTGGSNTTYVIQANGWNGSNASASRNGDSVVFTPTSEFVNVRIIVISGVSVSNQMFYPMLRLSTVTDATFKPYYVPLKDVVPTKADNSVIGTVEGENASKAWSVGEHFIRNGKFCTVTQAISSGGTLTEGTNYTSGQVGDVVYLSGSKSIAVAANDVAWTDFDDLVPFNNYDILGFSFRGNGGYIAMAGFTWVNAIDHPFRVVARNFDTEESRSWVIDGYIIVRVK